MSLIVLIACAAQKLDHPAPAADLYTSALFKGSLRYARKLKPDVIHVLSAKWILVANYGCGLCDRLVQACERTPPSALLLIMAELTIRLDRCAALEPLDAVLVVVYRIHPHHRTQQLHVWNGCDEKASGLLVA